MSLPKILNKNKLIWENHMMIKKGEIIKIEKDFINRYVKKDENKLRIDIQQGLKVKLKI